MIYAYVPEQQYGRGGFVAVWGGPSINLEQVEKKLPCLHQILYPRNVGLAIK